MTNDAIRVKALEWKKSRLPGEENILCAESPFGVYRAHVYNSFCRASLDYRTIADFAAFPTLEEAKAACQADFARRVAECVEANTGWRDISTAPKDGRRSLHGAPTKAGSNAGGNEWAASCQTARIAATQITKAGITENEDE